MINQSSHGSVEILLVEDNPGDVRLVMEAFKEGKYHHHLSVVTDGEEAIAFLHQRGCFSDAPRPKLVLLDINLPKKNGLEVLKEIKRDETLRCIPVIVLTASQASHDISHAYMSHANCFITKPMDLEAFIEVIHHIEDFWLSIVELPKE